MLVGTAVEVGEPLARLDVTAEFEADGDGVGRDGAEAELVLDGVWLPLFPITSRTR